MTDRAQEDLRQDLEQQLVASASVSPAGRPGADRPAPRPLQVTQGEGFGLMRIPKIGLEQVIVEGADKEALRKGPGHIPSTELPGQAGNVAVAGHRTTYGAPFFDLDKLRRGDEITMQTPGAVHVYRVTRTLIVKPEDIWVLDDRKGPDGRPKSTITLSTCNPKYSAAQRLIIFGDLVQTQDSPAPAAVPAT